MKRLPTCIMCALVILAGPVRSAQPPIEARTMELSEREAAKIERARESKEAADKFFKEHPVGAIVVVVVIFVIAGAVFIAAPQAFAAGLLVSSCEA